MTTSREDVLETHLRYAGTGQIFINKDASWSIGPSTTELVPVHFGPFASINDDTFGFSAVAVDRTANGYLLYVRSDADKNTLIEVRAAGSGEVDPNSVTVLSRTQLFAAEERLKFDLNGNGSIGADFVVLDGGVANLYKSPDGIYALGTSAANAVLMSVGGAPLTDQVLPPGWQITKVLPATAGYDVFAKDPSGVIFAAQFSAAGVLTGGGVISAAQIASTEQARGVDLNENNDLAAATGWTSVLKTASIKASVDAALADGRISHAEAVAIVDGVIQAHKASGATISADEVTDLQAISARGKAVFGSTPAGDYLAFVFSKMVDGSVANRFYTGGQLQSVELGNLAPDAPASLLEKLADKWLLGGDMPSPKTGGDKANPAAREASPTYAKSTGSLFVDGVSFADVSQGSAGDCYLIAAMLGVAAVSPAAITAMVVENAAIGGARSWGVRFIDARGNANWVTVNDMLPVGEGNKLQYAGNQAKDPHGEIWVPLVEKAYAQANMLEILPRAETTGQNSYFAIEGGQADPLASIVGGKVTAFQFANIANANPYLSRAVVTDPANASEVASLVTTLTAAMNAGKAIWVGTDQVLKDSFGNTLLAAGHAQLGLDPDPASAGNTTMLVYNPWGLAAAPTPPGPSEQGHISPATLPIVELVGLPGIEFWILEGG